MSYTFSASPRRKFHRLLPVFCLCLVLILAIGCAVFFAIRSHNLMQDVDALQQQVSDAQQQLQDAQQQLTDAANKLQDAQQQVTQLQGQLDQLQNSGSNNPDTDQPSNNQPDNSGSQSKPDWDTSGSVDPNGPAYQKLYPDFYAPQPYAATVEANKTIYLTFDDGPSERTDEILDILKQENIKATFFVLHYKNTTASHARMKRIVDEGHTLAFHSYTHQYKTIYASVEAYLDDAYKIFSEIKEATGTTPSIFRCPGGSRNGHNKTIYKTILAEMERRGFVCHDWNLSVEDSVLPYKTAEEMTDFLMSYVGKKTRGVVLMHDAAGRKETVKALPEIIKRFRDKGFTFAPLTPDVKPYLLGGK